MIPPLSSARPVEALSGVPLKPFPSSSVLHDLDDKPLVALNRVVNEITLSSSSFSKTPGHATATASQLLRNQTVYFSKRGDAVQVKPVGRGQHTITFDDALNAARTLSKGPNNPVGVVDAGDGTFLLVPLQGDGPNGRGQSANMYPLGAPSRTDQDVPDKAAFERFVRQYAASDAEARDSAQRAWGGSYNVLVQPAYELVEPLHPAVKALVEPNSFADLRSYSGGPSHSPSA